MGLIKDLIIKRNTEKLKWMAEHKCKQHNHTYLTHPNCYFKDFPHELKIGYFDIESGASLTADWGYMFCYCIRTKGSKHVIKNIITPKEVRNPAIRDKRLVRDLCHDLLRFDLVVVYYGNGKNRHDFPFARTRAVKWGLPFPTEDTFKVRDLYDVIKLKFKLARRRMTDACRLFGIEVHDDPVIPEIWQSALTGDKKALQYIANHCEDDVRKLEELDNKIVPFRDIRSKL